MTHKQLRKFFWQIGIYGAVLIYLALDLFVFHGPLAKKISSKDPNSAAAAAIAKANGVVAQVYNHSITRSQVERAARERLWRIGQDYEELSEKQQELARYAALDDLINHELLRVKAMVHTDKLVLKPEDLEARVERFKRRFTSDQALHTAMKSQGIEDEQELRDRIAAQMQQEAYVELKIEPLSEVSEEDAREWFEQNQTKISNPEHRRLRHIFLPSLTQDKEIAVGQLEAAKVALATGQSNFATLAAELSQDPATKDVGGEIGWVHQERLPQDFAKAVWQLPLNTPAFVQSKIGWHLVEVLESQPAEPQSFEEAKEEIIAALRTLKRRNAIEEYRKALRQFEGHRVTIYHDMMR